MSARGAMRYRSNHILISVLGGNEAEPVVTRVEMRRDSVLLLCSTGLTKQVPQRASRFRQLRRQLQCRLRSYRSPAPRALRAGARTTRARQSR